MTRHRLAICCTLAGAIAIGLVADGRRTQAATAQASRRVPASRRATTSRPVTPEEAASALERDVISMFASLDPNTDLDALRSMLGGVVGRYFADLKPNGSPRTIASADGRFVVGIVADAAAGQPGAGVSFEARGVELLLVLGGNAGMRTGNAKLSGGEAHASAPEGIAIALGGAGTAGGWGGGASAHGHLGAIAVKGFGVTGPHGTDADRSGHLPVHVDAIVAAAKAWGDAK